MSDDSLWYVKTADGDVHRVSLDQLDDAFNAGRIDENVMVLQPGDTRWMRLGDLLGADEPAPAANARPARAAFEPVPNSLRPVSMDLSDDVDETAFKKKSKKPVVIGAAVAVLAIFGGILVANRMHAGDSSAAAAAVVAPPPVTAAPPPLPAPAPPPAATTPPATDTSAADRFNAEQKAKLLAADKALDAKIKAKKKNRAEAAGSRSPSHKYKSQGFTTGGNKYDPLNASL